MTVILSLYFIFISFKSLKFRLRQFFVTVPIVFMIYLLSTNRFEFCSSYGAWMKVLSDVNLSIISVTVETINKYH